MQLPQIALFVGLFWLVLLTGLVAYLASLVLKTNKRRVKRTQVISSSGIDDLTNQVHDLSTKLQKTVSHVGIVRFNPFNDVGGEQSYAIALLDGDGDGVVISNLHSRSVSRTYAKRITGGKSIGHELSSEEERAITQALTDVTS